MRRAAVLVVLVVGVFGRAIAADSLNCRLVGSCRLPYAVVEVALSGNLAYVSGVYGLLYILDVSDPTAPYEVGRFDTTDMSRSVAVSGCFAYLTAYGSLDGLWIIDISDPQEPYAVGRYSSFCRVEDIVLSSDFAYAYMPAGFMGMRILDTSDPQEPYEVGHWDGLGKTRNVALFGNLACVAEMDSGLLILDVSSPQAPQEVGRCSLPSATFSVAVSGDFAYVGGADLFGKLRVINVSNPHEPHEAGWVGFRDLGTGVAVSGDFVYVVGPLGLYVVDASDPQSPHLAGWYEGSELHPVDVAVSGNLAYVTDYESGLKIIEFLGEGVEEAPNVEVRAAKCMPTVVRDVLMLGAADSRQQTVDRAELLDAAGRKVVALHAGANDVRALAPGVYFVREAQAQTQAIRKVVITR